MGASIMTQTAVHTSTTSAATTANLATAIDRYVAATFAGYQAAVIAVVPSLGEPRVTDPDLAFRTVRKAIETLVGVAVGSTIGTVAAALRRGFGAETRAAVAAELARIAHGDGPLSSIATLGTPPRFLPPGDTRPLVDELGARLVARLRHAIAFTRRHIAALLAGCAEPPSSLATMLDSLATDDSATLGYSDQLTVGWSHVRSRLANTQLPTVPAHPRFARASTTWMAWSSRVRNLPEPVLSEDADLVASGYLMRIA